MCSVVHFTYFVFCLQEGFKYHHAEEAYLMLTYWIPDEPSLLPANASHQVGVGGFVINDQMEVGLANSSDGNRLLKKKFLCLIAFP